MREVLEKLVEGNSLSKEEALVVFEKMAQGEVSDSVAGGIPVSYTHLTLPTNREV